MKRLIKNSYAMLQTSSAQGEIMLRPRPGIFYGIYPARMNDGESVLEKYSAMLVRKINSLLLVRSKDKQAFVDAVKAMDEVLSCMNDRVLDAWVVDLKKKIHRKGLTEKLVTMAFAAIREVSRRELGKAHYDCQLMAGRVLLDGKVAEMQTGEGKTLTAALPVACAAMAGIPVHLITANEYLVVRDLELMSPVYRRLGLSSACITVDMDNDARRQVYSSDIVYCSGQQLVFDYLKDRLLLRRYGSDLELRLASLYENNDLSQNLLLRGLNYAVIDEADSVLIDEARTPLILSRKTDDALSESVHREAIWLARELNQNSHFLCDIKSRHVELNADGEAMLETLAADMSGVWRGRRRRAVLVKQALKALHLYRRDIDYIVLDNKIVIVDENTGRSMPDRSWEAGLHQMIEEKENCEQTGLNETIARISFQRFFSRYHKLSGMTGTAHEVRAELSDVYGLSVEKIPTNKKSMRKDLGEHVYDSHGSKWLAVVASAEEFSKQGRPVLIGTRTVEDSQIISELLNAHGLDHQLLNARQDESEAQIVSQAGRASQVTVATNMAGRGTDIPLDKAALEAGGLHVICCEKNISSRIDRQLYGRCARQGDPGSFQAMVSVDDVAAGKYFASIMSILGRYSSNMGLIKAQWVARMLIKLSQHITETSYRRLRKAMMKSDRQRENMMAFSGKSE